jgi:hypothetical protein
MRIFFQRNWILNCVETSLFSTVLRHLYVARKFVGVTMSVYCSDYFCLML